MIKINFFVFLLLPSRNKNNTHPENKYRNTEFCYSKTGNENVLFHKQYRCSCSVHGVPFLLGAGGGSNPRCSSAAATPTPSEFLGSSSLRLGWFPGKNRRSRA